MYMNGVGVGVVLFVSIAVWVFNVCYGVGVCN